MMGPGKSSLLFATFIPFFVILSIAIFFCVLIENKIQDKLPQSGFFAFFNILLIVIYGFLTIAVLIYWGDLLVETKIHNNSLLSFILLMTPFLWIALNFHWFRKILRNISME